MVPEIVGLDAGKGLPGTLAEAGPPNTGRTADVFSRQPSRDEKFAKSRKMRRGVSDSKGDLVVEGVERELELCVI